MGLDNKLILIFSMDGNILDNLHVKAECFGKAMQQNVRKEIGIDKSVEFYSKIYVETMGANAPEQIEAAFRTVSSAPITQDFLQRTEQYFRDCLEVAELSTHMFKDAKDFLTQNKSNYHCTISTTVPLERIDIRAKRTGIDRFFEIICARGGVWEPERQIMIPGFDKGKAHYDYLANRFNSSKDKMVTVSATRPYLESSRANNIISIGLTRIINSEEMQAINPDYIIENYTQLPRLLERLSKS